MDIQDQISIQKLTKFRRFLHQNPELSGFEHKTQSAIAKYLKDELNLTAVNVGGTGLLLKFESNIDDSTILIRGDIDALPIAELNDFEHKSLVPNVSHKCGHDGHTTILCALAELLVKNPIKKGSVYLLFQPAEEIGKGAEAVTKDENFKHINFDYCYALHNIPSYPKASVIVKKGAFTADVQSLVLKFNGKTAHAAEPEMGANPAIAISETIALINKVQDSNIQSDKFFISAITHVHVGLPDTFGISAGDGDLRYTFRAWSSDWMQQKSNECLQMAQQIAQKYQLELSYYWTDVFKANNNDVLAVEHLEKALNKLNIQAVYREQPFKWGEDFGLFTQKFKGAMFGLGAGEDCPALHNPDYDFPDEITATGASVFYHTIQTILA